MYYFLLFLYNDMGWFDFLKKKTSKETQESSAREGIMRDRGDDLINELDQGREKSEHGLSYIEEKLSGLREQAERYAYQQEFVPTYYMDEKNFLETMKMRVESLRKTIFILLFFSNNGFSDKGNHDIDEMRENIEKMSGSLRKTIAMNLLQKIEGEQAVLSLEDINNSSALISSAKKHLSLLKEQLKTIETELEKIERPDSLSVDQNEEIYKEYEGYYRKMEISRLRLRHAISIFDKYIATSEFLYTRKEHLEQLQDDNIEKTIRENNQFQHLQNPTLLALEKKKLETDIDEAKNLVVGKRKMLANEIIVLEEEKIKKTIDLLNTQWKRIYHKNDPKTGLTTILYYHVEGRIAEQKNPEILEETSITKVTIDNNAYQVAFDEISDEEMIGFLENEGFDDWGTLKESLSDKNIETTQLALIETISSKTQLLRNAQKNWDIENNNIEPSFFYTLDEFARKNVFETKEYTDICGVKIASEEMMYDAISELFFYDLCMDKYNFYPSEDIGQIKRHLIHLEHINTHIEKHGKLKWKIFSLASHTLIESLLEKLPGKNRDEKLTALLYFCPQLSGINWLANQDGGISHCIELTDSIKERQIKRSNNFEAGTLLVADPEGVSYPKQANAHLPPQSSM